MTLVATRPFGWCQDYDPSPAAQHWRCDGELGPSVEKNYRCPCECHEARKDLEVTKFGDDAWGLVLPIKKPLSMNDRKDWRSNADEVATLRQAAGWLAKAAKIPKCEKIRTTLIYEPKDKRRRDPINLMATLKPVQDGLVDVGIVPDDTPEFMETVTPLIDEPSGKDPKIWVLVERVR